MKKHLVKLLLLAIFLTVTKIGTTNAYFSSGLVLSNNTFSTGCWVAPSVPVLNYPADNTYSDPVWNNNPHMDWNDSSSSCPIAGTITYQYESYTDPLLHNLAYRSSWLTNSFIPAPGTPQATYYWRVRAKDSYGNTSEFSAPWKFIVDHSQVLAPTNLHWINPEISCGGYTNSYIATATWNSVPNATSYVYQVDYPLLSGGRGLWSTTVSNPRYSGVFNQAEGVHTYHVYAINNIGKTSPWSEYCSVTYDKTKPTSVITKPWNSDADNDVIYPIVWIWDGKVEGTASDNFEIDHVELSIYRSWVDKYWNGTAWINGTEETIRVDATGTTNWSYQINPLYIPFGKFKIIAHAVDKAGNIENSATIEFEYTDSLTTDINVVSNRLANKINLEITNISSPLDYEILYTGNGTEKGIFGHVNIDEIIDSKYSKDFYFGTCSAGGCTPETVEAGSDITVSLTNGVTFTKKFNY